MTQNKQHKFWNTQPILQNNEEKNKQTDHDSEDGLIDVKKTPADVKPDPYKLPDLLTWKTMNLNDENDIDQVYQLLYYYYVEDASHRFRLSYSKETLKWAMCPPGYFMDLHIGILKDNKELIGFISAIPVNIRIRKNTLRTCEVNFLCVNKNYRSLGLAPILIKEVTRRLGLVNIFHSVYTAGLTITKPISNGNYWLRALNPSKLLNVKLINILPRFAKARNPLKLMQLYYNIPKTTHHVLRPFKCEDGENVCNLLNNFLDKFLLSQVWSKEEIIHTFSQRNDVIYTYVYEINGVITDLLSFYILNNKVIDDAKKNIIKIAYSFYIIPGTLTLEELYGHLFKLAKDVGCDLVNTLDIMDNKIILDPLKFTIGTGNLKYYIYNWKTNIMKSEQIGLVLV